MNVRYSNVSGFKKYTILMAVCILLSIALVAAVPSVAAKEYLPPTYEYTNNFYNSYGEPDISASIVGDTEFCRGETAQLNVVLSNRGVLYGAKSVKNVGTSEAVQQLAMTELEYESMRTTAQGVKATLVSDSDFIKVDPSTSSHTLDKVVPGQLSDLMTFTLTISDNAPAGVYMLELPVEYEYQSDVRMTTNAVTQLGLSTDHAKYYTNANTTMTIPVVVEAAPYFEVSDVSGSLTAGEAGVINVTYTNTGELVAKDAVARIVAMKPLSTENSVKSLGTLQPGESRTVSYTISADSTAVEKVYGIDNEIRYIDEDEEIVFSENMKVNVDLRMPETQINITGLAIAGLLVMGLVLIINNIRKNAKNNTNRNSGKNHKNNGEGQI